MSAVLNNPHTGETKVIPMGFSWTTLFFWFWPALFRGNIKWAAIMLIAVVPSFTISMFVFPFIYNKLYFNDLLKKGFRPAGFGGGAVAMGGPQQVVQQFHINAGNSSPMPQPAYEHLPMAPRRPLMAPRIQGKTGAVV